MKAGATPSDGMDVRKCLRKKPNDRALKQPARGLGLVMATRAQGGSGMLGRQQLASMLGEVARGDRVAFARLYEASSRDLYAIVLRIARRRDLADELLQEAYLRIWQHAAQFNPLRTSPMTWMATIARNCALDETRRAASRPTKDYSALLEVPSDCTPFTTDEATEDASSLQGCLERLGPERRALVVRAYCLGLTREEIARATGHPVATIKTWLRRTLLELRRHLDEEADVVAMRKLGQECDDDRTQTLP
jgi:RNA polymerase sigma-70 factor, ECF subfamily